MALDAKNLNAYDFIRDFRGAMNDRLHERLESGEFFPLLEARMMHSFDSEATAAAFAKVNVGKNPSKPVMGSKSGKWNVSVDTKDSPIHGKGAQSNKAPMHEGVLDENVRKDTMDTDWTAMGTEEKDTVINLRALGKQLGSDEGAYGEGVMCLTFKNKLAVEDFLFLLDSVENVASYELEARRDNQMTGAVDEKEYDFDDVMMDGNFEFDVYIYLNPNIVMMPLVTIAVPHTFQWNDQENNGTMTEVVRGMITNYLSEKTVNLRCGMGFMWNAAKRTCSKMTAAQKQLQRRAGRESLMSKMSKGPSMRLSVKKGMHRARKFRAGMGAL